MHTQRTVLVTGVSRRRGIGYAIARRLVVDESARVFAHGYSSYDASEPWGADPGGVHGLLSELGSGDERLVHSEGDLSEPAAPQRVMDTAVERFGPVDALVLNHAQSRTGSIVEITSTSLDTTWQVNVRATLLLVHAFTRQYQPHPHGGRIVLFTSGQHNGPATGEVPYAATKGALQQITATVADELADREITVNCLNPGPTDTGWARPDQSAFVARHMPRGRWNTPAEAADVVSLLLSPQAATITGQVIDAEGGFRRYTP